MPTQAKRYGLEVQSDLEMELRLRRIEQQLERLVGSNLLEGDDDTKRLGSIPQVTGLRVSGSTPGAITLAWNSVPISDLRRYELQIAEDVGFSTSSQSFNVAGTSHQFSTASEEGGGGGMVIYARVRAWNRTSSGPWSITLNTSTGQAQSEDIGDGEVTIAQIDITTIEELTFSVSESDGSPTFANTNNLIFNSNDFYLTATSAAAPVVNLVNPYVWSGLIDLPTGAGQATYTHNFGYLPNSFTAFLVNVTTDEGYDPGDYVPLTQMQFGSNSDDGKFSAWFNDTECGVTFNDVTQRLPHKDTGNGDTSLVRTRWRVRFLVYR